VVYVGYSPCGLPLRLFLGTTSTKANSEHHPGFRFLDTNLAVLPFQI
jgi:hypothetical protein